VRWRDVPDARDGGRLESRERTRRFFRVRRLMNMSAASHLVPQPDLPGHARSGPLVVLRSQSEQVRAVAWFIGLSLGLVALAAGTTLAAPDSEIVAADVPFVLALGPAVVAVCLAWREGDGSMRRLWRSLGRRPANARWYLVLLLPVLWAFAVVGVAIGLGEPTAGLFDDLLPGAVIVSLVVLLPAFAEELAWRGFATPRLMAAMSPLRVSLVLAIPWIALHLVLHLPGAMNDSAAVWPTVLSVFAYSVLLTWIFVGTGGSVLLAALVHAGLNGVVPIMSGLDAEAAWAVRAVLAAVIAIAVVGLGGFRRVVALSSHTTR